MPSPDARIYLQYVTISISARDPPQTQLGELIALLQSPGWCEGASYVSVGTSRPCHSAVWASILILV